MHVQHVKTCTQLYILNSIEFGFAEENQSCSEGTTDYSHKILKVREWAKGLAMGEQ